MQPSVYIKPYCCKHACQRKHKANSSCQWLREKRKFTRNVSARPAWCSTASWSALDDSAESSPVRATATNAYVADLG